MLICSAQHLVELGYNVDQLVVHVQEVQQKKNIFVLEQNLYHSEPADFATAHVSSICSFVDDIELMFNIYFYKTWII